MKTLLLIAALLVGAVLAAPAGAATRAGAAGPWGSPATGAGPQTGEVALGSFVTPSRAGTGGPGPAGSPPIKAGVGCRIQCITRGVAYGRGPDARLVVATDTPAKITIVVSRAGYNRVISSDAGATVLEADFDDLDADTHYDAFVSAVDGAGHIANRSGSFTTLQRNAHVVFTEAHISAAPFGGAPFDVRAWVQGESSGPPVYGLDADDGVLGLGINILDLQDVDRDLEVAVQLTQSDTSEDVCEYVDPGPEPSSGSWDCDVWASAGFPDGGLDLDDRPGGAGNVNDYAITAVLALPGGALPAGFGESLSFTVPVGITVTFT